VSTAPAAHEASFSLRSVQSMLGLSASVVSALIDAGFVQPARGPRNAYRFSFQDVVLLRTAHRLRAANIPPRKVLRALARLKATLPQELPLTGLRITAVGSDVAVRDGALQWAAESGQLLMDFDVAAAGDNVAFLERTPAADVPDLPPAADAQALEAHDKPAAEKAYRRAIAADVTDTDAYVNLSALLCEQGKCRDAVALLADAVQRLPDEPLLHFNQGIALEDLGRHAEAIESYERCIALNPDLADAHFNLARIHEQVGQPQKALRHYGEYRRLQR
jgi:tetratricopeptide (TPR) repeat protein